MERALLTSENGLLAQLGQQLPVLPGLDDHQGLFHLECSLFCDQSWQAGSKLALQRATIICDSQVPVFSPLCGAIPRFLEVVPCFTQRESNQTLFSFSFLGV